MLQRMSLKNVIINDFVIDAEGSDELTTHI